MAYQMIHLEVAYRLLKQINAVENEAQFILGSVAPDSVHMNPEYEVSDKVKSHLFEGCGPWGDTKDYDRWIENILNFWNEYKILPKGSDKRDFALGITVHCLTDYCNDLDIWRKLQKPYLDSGVMTMEEFREDFYPEAKGIDQWLYANSNNTEEVMRLLEKGIPMEVSDLLKPEDEAKMIANLTRVQYANAKATAVSGYKYITVPFIQDFLNNTVDFILKNIE